MEKIELKNIGDYTEIYTYNELNKNIVDEDNFIIFFNDVFLNKEYSELEELLDKYTNYLYDLIDESDYLIYSNCKEELRKLENLIDHKKVDIIDSKNNENIYSNIDLFNLKTDKNKNILKDELKYNVGDYERENIEVSINKKYIYNEFDENKLGYYRFIKDNLLLAVLWQQDSYLYDYRPKEEIGKHIEKYRKMK